MKTPGLIKNLAESLARIDPLTQQGFGMSGDELLKVVAGQQNDPAAHFPCHPNDKDLSQANDVSAEDEALGERAIAAGEVACVFFSSNLDTSIIPTLGMSVIAWKLLTTGNMPVWILTSKRDLECLSNHVSKLALAVGMNGTIFDGFDGYMLSADNRLQWMEKKGVPCRQWLGDGDLAPALRQSTILTDNPKIKYVHISDVANLLGNPHTGIIGRHIRRQRSMTCELVKNSKSFYDQKLACPAWVDNRLELVHPSRMHDSFALESKYVSTNSFVVNVELFQNDPAWQWVRTREIFKAATYIMYKRMFHQHTACVDADMIVVPRESRCLQVFDEQDLVHAGAFLEEHRFK